MNPQSPRKDCPFCRVTMVEFDQGRFVCPRCKAVIEFPRVTSSHAGIARPAETGG